MILKRLMATPVVGTFSSPTPTAEPTAKTAPAPTSSPTPEPMATPTPAPTSTPTPEPTASPAPTPLPTLTLAPQSEIAAAIEDIKSFAIEANLDMSDLLTESDWPSLSLFYGMGDFRRRQPDIHADRHEPARGQVFRNSDFPTASMCI